MGKIDRRSLGKLLNDLVNLKQKVNTTAKKIETNTKKEVRENLEYIGRTAVDMFYEDYQPRKYQRNFDLYNAYKIRVNDTVWEITTDAKYMIHTHEAGNEYIFWNSFENGFHGGAVSGPQHPNPGEPWWKVRGHWFSPAAGGRVSPLNYIEEKADEYLDSVPQQMQNEFDSSMAPLLDSVITQFNKVFR